MERINKLTKIKGPVTIRVKPCKYGNQSIYLDIYRNGFRKKEYLKMYLIPEHTKEDRRLNQITMQAVNAIKAERMLKILNDEAGIKTQCSKVLLIDWMKQLRRSAEKKALEDGRSNASNSQTFESVIRHLESYISSNYENAVTLQSLDKKFCLGFGEYLKNVRNRRGGNLSANTRYLYFTKLSTALNAAVNSGLLLFNPVNYLDKTDKPRHKQSERGYLTEEELQLLINTPNTHTRQEVSRAFLFSCFCGLRWSDVFALKWEDVRRDRDSVWIEKRIVKTQELLYLPLNREAVFFMPEKGEKKRSDNIFFLSNFDTANRALKKWARDAGIKKSITFHSARHTFATLLLTQNQDLYIVSKLLGHKNINVTQIYAAVVDKKKNEAVNSLNGLFNLGAFVPRLSLE